MSTNRFVRKTMHLISYVASLACGLATSTFAQSYSPNSCTVSSAEVEAPLIAQAIQAWYASEWNNDLAEWNAHLTQDFYTFDEGFRRSGDDLFRIVGPQSQRTRQRVPDISVTTDPRDLRVQVSCNAALATDTLYAVADSQQQHKHRENIYLESYWLKKQDGSWRIAFQQTTRISKQVPLLVSLQPSRPSPVYKSDAASIIRVIRAWIDAEERGNIGQFEVLTTPDFYAFNEGKRVTGDELVQLEKQHLAETHKSDRKISHPDVTIDGSMALATWTSLDPSAHNSDEQKILSLDSAVLRETSGQWRVIFLHRTTVTESAKP